MYSIRAFAFSVGLHLAFTEAPDDVCTDNRYRETYNDTSICLECSVCPPGYWVQRQCGARHNTVCQPCPRSTFSRKNNSDTCRSCRKCPMYSPEIRPCTATRNAKCKTCPDNTFYSNVTNSCDVCTVCPPGTFVDKKCTDRSDTVCTECPSGTYSDRNNMYPFCRICQQCRRFEEILQICNRTQDNKCGNCRTGFFRHQSTLTCWKCSPCYYHVTGHRYDIVSECQEKTNDSNTICFPIKYVPRTVDIDPIGDSFRSTRIITTLHHRFISIQASNVVTVTLPILNTLPHDPTGSQKVENAFKISQSSSSRIFDFDTRNPAVIMGTIAVILLIAILVSIVVIIIYFYKARVRSRKSPYETETFVISNVEETGSIEINSYYIKTCQYVNEIKEPSVSRAFSEPNLGVNVLYTKTEDRPTSWPRHPVSRWSFRKSVCSFFDRILKSNTEDCDNISNSLRNVDEGSCTDPEQYFIQSSNNSSKEMIIDK